jgi:V/A-type H+-transporting ATPase subunit K
MEKVEWFKKWRTISFSAIVFVALLVVGVGLTQAADGDDAMGEDEEVTEEVEMGVAAVAELEPSGQMALFIAIASTVAVSCIAAGYAVGKVGAAALGAATERPEILGRALIFVGLAEGVAIYGLIIGIMLIVKML